MMSFVRKITGNELSFEKGLSSYKVEKRELDLLEEELSFLSFQYKETTDSFSKALKQYPDKKEGYNNRYNIFFGDYIDNVKEIRLKIEDLQKSIQSTKSSTPFLEDYLEIINSILKKDYTFKFEKYIPLALSKTRDSMPQYSYKNINKLIAKLSNEKITLNKVSLPINILKPTQIDIDSEKVISMIENGVDDKKFIPIVSKDLHILDGHHTWAAKLEEDEDQIAEAWLINMPMYDLLEEVEKFKDLQKAAITILKFAIDQGQLPGDLLKSVEVG